MASLTPECFWQHEISTETKIASSGYQEKHHTRPDLTEGEKYWSAISHKYLPWFKSCQSSEHPRDVHWLNSPSTSSKMPGFASPSLPEILKLGSAICRPPKGFPKPANVLSIQPSPGHSMHPSRYPYPSVLPSVQNWIQIPLPSLMVTSSCWTKFSPVTYFPLFYRNKWKGKFRYFHCNSKFD